MHYEIPCVAADEEERREQISDSRETDQIPDELNGRACTCLMAFTWAVPRVEP
jgi:hypothetical protein